MIKTYVGSDGLLDEAQAVVCGKVMRRLVRKYGYCRPY